MPAYGVDHLDKEDGKEEMVSITERREEILIIQMALAPMRKMKMKMKKRWSALHYGGKMFL